VDSVKIVEAIQDHHVTNAFGSPALWSRVATYCVERGIRLPTLRRILIAGAPVPYHVIEKLHRVLGPEADVHTPYGATESLPVSSISGREILDGCVDISRRGGGTCVGRALPGIDLRFIQVTDEPIDAWSDDLLVADGEIGEIVVSGPVVTKAYFGLEQATALAKIRDNDRVWHRIGDVGYRDETGRVWFCGRKSHRVVTESGTMYSVRCEAVFNEHPHVMRSALVGVGPHGRQRPVIVIEPVAGRRPSRAAGKRFREELLELGRANEMTRPIRDVLFHRGFPVDIRHNAKIDREALAQWAAGCLQ
jgi:acyl-CoA synthetase (AMP-forming)/AMP-acid ligase II